MGRKGRYETHVQPFLKDIAKWYVDMDEAEIAKRLGVAVSTWEKYKREHKELRDSLLNGRQELVTELKTALKKKAKGYYYEETKTCIRADASGKEVKIVEKYKKYAHPDTGAIHLLLKNLDDDWRNDDAATMKMKQEQVDIAKEKAENASW